MQSDFLASQNTQLLSHSGAHLAEPPDEHARTTQLNSDSVQVCFLASLPVLSGQSCHLILAAPSRPSGLKPVLSLSEMPAASHRSMCTLCFCLQVAGLSHCTHAQRPARPQRRNQNGLAASLTQKLNMLCPTCFVSPVSKWITLATLSNLP